MVVPVGGVAEPYLDRGNPLRGPVLRPAPLKQ